MKIKPELLIIKNNDISYKKILITGSDEVFINYLTGFILKKFKNNNFYIDDTGGLNKNLVGDLFSDKKVLFLTRDMSLIKKILEISESGEHTIMISAPNGKKITTLKNEFAKSKDSLVVECYSLNRASKELFLKYFVDTKKIKLTQDVFWYVLENFDNNFVLFKQQLETLSLLDVEKSSISEIERAIFVENKIELNKMLFHVFKNNKILIKAFTQNIYSQADFYIFLNSLKLYLNIISDSSSKEDALSKFPRYLFNEREIFIKIYNHLNKNKIIKIYRGIIKAETLVRKNSSLYFIIGLRFLISTKQIITS